MKRTIQIIGWGDGSDLIDEKTTSKLKEFDIIFVPKGKSKRLPDCLQKKLRFFRSPFMDALISDIDALKANTKIAIIASGDPMWYGIGGALAKRNLYNLQVSSEVSSFAIASSRLKWAMEDVKVISLHGSSFSRSLEGVAKDLNHQKMLIIPAGKSTPAKLVNYLALQDNKYTMLIMEHLGNPELEKIYEIPIKQNAKLPVIDPFHLIALKAEKPVVASVSFIDDASFEGDKLTKWYQRSIILSWLSARNNAILWDVGAGSGSISIEWIKKGGQAVAFEKDEKSLDFIKNNLAKLCTDQERQQITTIKGDFNKNNLKNIEAPHAIFIGGSLQKKTIEKCLKKLKSSGRMVATAVTKTGQNAIIDAHAEYGGILKRISIEELQDMSLGSPYQVWRPKLPQIIWLFNKGK